MQLTIVDAEKRLSKDALSNARRRLLFALSRFDSKIRCVALNIRDLNGPKGGVDTECRLQIRPHRGDTIFLSDRDSNADVAVARVADRARRAVMRRLSRGRDLRRRRETEFPM